MRNAKVVEMAKAGKSRWGEAEIQKLKTLPHAAEAKGRSAADLMSNTNRVNIGATLADRIQLGANLETTTTPSALAHPPVANDFLYETRNAKVVEMAKAGKSRWGEAEIQKLKTLPHAAEAKKPFAAADLMSNTNRVNIGAMLLSSWLLALAGLSGTWFS
jgi:hypothetical protein